MNNLLIKITGGRFIFTVVAAAVFGYMSLSGLLSSDKVMEVILIVIYAYFNRTDRQKS
jgi:hypothetical protein